MGRTETLIFSGLPSFIKAPWIPCEVDEIKSRGAKAAFLGLPFDQATALRSGENYGPKALRAVSEMYLPYFGDFGIDFFEDFGLVDVGDVPVIPANAQRSRDAIEDYVGRILDAGALPLVCGGDHSCPIPSSRALTSRTTGKVGYLHVDTHMDAAPDMQGELYTNWSTVSRIVEDKKVNPENVALVGIHGVLNPKEQHEFVRDNGIGLYETRTIIERGIESVMAEALERVANDTDAFYVSWDVDVIDCSAAPGTNGPEPGGLTTREALKAAEMIGAARPNVFDVCEYLPWADPTGVTGRLICYLYFHLLGGYATQGVARAS
jgi:arginase family enzyme